MIGPVWTTVIYGMRLDQERGRDKTSWLIKGNYSLEGGSQMLLSGSNLSRRSWFARFVTASSASVAVLAGADRALAAQPATSTTIALPKVPPPPQPPPPKIPPMKTVLTAHPNLPPVPPTPSPTDLQNEIKSLQSQLDYVYGVLANDWSNIQELWNVHWGHSHQYSWYNYPDQRWETWRTYYP